MQTDETSVFPFSLLTNLDYKNMNVVLICFQKTEFNIKTQGVFLRRGHKQRYKKKGLIFIF